MTSDARPTGADAPNLAEAARTAAGAGAAGSAALAIATAGASASMTYRRAASESRGEDGIWCAGRAAELETLCDEALVHLEAEASSDGPAAAVDGARAAKRALQHAERPVEIARIAVRVLRIAEAGAAELAGSARRELSVVGRLAHAGSETSLDVARERLDALDDADAAGSTLRALPALEGDARRLLDSLISPDTSPSP